MTLPSLTSNAQKPYQMVMLEPAHFHAALVQKTMYSQIDPNVHVYAPQGPELNGHLALIDGYNKREIDPTSWKEIVYVGPDYFDKMLSEKAGNLLVLAGNNKNKTDYILRSVNAGFNILADKPMAIDEKGFSKLKEAFDAAKKNNVLMYDIMTERYDATNIIQREIMQISTVFGVLQKGTAKNPAVVKKSTHHFFKSVSGKPLIRPAWYFDVEQEGEGIVDVTTHLVDIVKWTCFPQKILDYKKDIVISSAKRWPTKITRAQFEKVTQLNTYPDYLQKDVQNGDLQVFANGEMNYTLNGVTVKITAIWNFEAPPGEGDTYFSLVRGSKCDLMIRQGTAENFKTVLYVEPKGDHKLSKTQLERAIAGLAAKYPGLSLAEAENGWKVVIPERYHIGHEAQFAEVTKKYLQYLHQGKMPEWEVNDMLSKHYTTVSALEKAKSSTK